MNITIQLDIKYSEVIRHTYAENNCVLSAGLCEGDPVDTMYIRFEKDGSEPFIIHVRPDEMAIIAWLASGALYSLHMGELIENESPD